MSTLQSVSQPTVDTNLDIDIDRSFHLWITRGLERNPELAKKINYVYQINIKRESNTPTSWILDLSDGKGSLYREPKKDIKCVVTIDESDLVKTIVDKNHWNTVFKFTLIFISLI